MNKTSPILVTGADGLIGSALVRLLKVSGYENILAPRRYDLDCLNPQALNIYFMRHEPKYVFHLAARVGGLHENDKKPGQFIYENTLMQCYILHEAVRHHVKKILLPGSACAYPRRDEDILESDFLRGPPEKTNIAYAAAKINGIVMAQSFAKQYGIEVILPMVANAYGPGDKSTHVIPEMIQKFRPQGSRAFFPGTGIAVREFIHADDVARAFLFLMLNYSSSDIINVGTQESITIRRLAFMISGIMGYKGEIIFQGGEDGAPRKVLNSFKLRSMGFSPRIDLPDGLRGMLSGNT